MATVTVPVTHEGIQIPSAAAELLGCRPGGWVRVEVHPLPSTEELENKALHYIWHRLGDAVFVDAPEWTGDGWTLRLRVRGYPGTFGQLFLTPEGEVAEEKSTSATEIDEALHARGASTGSA